MAKEIVLGFFLNSFQTSIFRCHKNFFLFDSVSCSSQNHCFVFVFHFGRWFHSFRMINIFFSLSHWFLWWWSLLLLWKLNFDQIMIWTIILIEERKRKENGKQKKISINWHRRKMKNENSNSNSISTQDGWRWMKINGRK